MARANGVGSVGPLALIGQPRHRFNAVGHADRLAGPVAVLLFNHRVAGIGVSIRYSMSLRGLAWHRATSAPRRSGHISPRCRRGSQGFAWLASQRLLSSVSWPLVKASDAIWRSRGKVNTCRSWLLATCSQVAVDVRDERDAHGLACQRPPSTSQRTKRSASSALSRSWAGTPPNRWCSRRWAVSLGISASLPLADA